MTDHETQPANIGGNAGDGPPEAVAQTNTNEATKPANPPADVSHASAPAIADTNDALRRVVDGVAAIRFPMPAPFVPAFATAGAVAYDEGSTIESLQPAQPDASQPLAEVFARLADALHRQGDTIRAVMAEDAEAQRAGFEAVVAEGRPTTVEVKAMLERLERCAIASRSHRFPAWGECADNAATMIDRLGCALIAQDAELAEANGALDLVASAAVPLDDEKLAELVQTARNVAEACEDGWESGQAPHIRAGQAADVITRLILATLDQARRAKGVAEAPDTPEQANAAVSPENGTYSPDEGTGLEAFDRLTMLNDDDRVFFGSMENCLAHQLATAREGYAKLFAEWVKAENARPRVGWSGTEGREILDLSAKVIQRYADDRSTVAPSEWSTIVSRLRWVVLELQSDLERERNNFAEAVSHWGWAQTIGDDVGAPRDLFTEHWGNSSGAYAEAVVRWLASDRDQAIAERNAAVEDRDKADAAHGQAVRDHRAAIAIERQDVIRAEAVSDRLGGLFRFLVQDANGFVVNAAPEAAHVALYFSTTAAAMRAGQAIIEAEAGQ